MEANLYLLIVTALVIFAGLFVGLRELRRG
jgi:hypothetical protein